MRNVLLSTYACIPNWGSEETTGWTYATLLSENGVKVDCLTTIDGKSTIEPLLAEGSFPNLAVHYVTLAPWADKFRHKGLFGMYFHYIYWQWYAYKFAQQLNQTRQFDLVHHATYGSIQLGSFMYKLGKPFLFGPVGGGQRAPKVLKRYFKEHWSREWKRDWVSNLLEYLNPAFYKTVKQADQLIVTNQDTYEMARRLRPTKHINCILDAGLSDSFVPPVPVERQPGPTLKLLWIGRLLPRKGLELNIQALSKVNPAIPVTLTIVGGKGEMAEHVPEYLERYGVKEKVNWVGHVSYEEVKQYCEQADVFFFTSLRDSCPHQIPEAMCYSLPVITLNIHGQAELVNEQTGIRVPVVSEEQVVTDLAKAIEWMYEHPTERLAMGRAAYEYTKSLLWASKIKVFTDDLYPATMGLSTVKSVGFRKEDAKES